MTTFLKITLCLICLVAFASPVFAVDQAGAASDLGESQKNAVKAASNSSEAALDGDVDKINEAKKRSDAVDASVAQAEKAYLEMERAIAIGDEDAAQTAADELKAALQNAINALNGVIPEEVVDIVREWKDSKKNTGGGKAKPYDPPNMYDVTWNSAQMSQFYQDEFGILFAAGSDNLEITPEGKPAIVTPD